MLKKSFYTPIINNGIESYFTNVHGDVEILQMGDQSIPLLITSGNFDDSYVCSTYGRYILLGLESLYIVKNQLLRKAAEKILKFLGWYIHQGKINNAVYVNHGLFSTDLHNDALTIEDIQSITANLKKRFPHHAIVFRSLTKKCCPNLMGHLAVSGYRFLVSAPVHITDMQNGELFNTRIIKSDMKFWNEHQPEVIDKSQLSQKDEERLFELYYGFSIEHHSKLNPQPTRDFISLLIKEPLFTLKAIKREGKIDGFIGYRQQGGTLTCSIFAYDKNCPDSAHLYRMLSTLLFLEAKKEAKIFHQSSGASFYKNIRRAEHLCEYLGIHISHLPLKQKSSWLLLKSIMNTAAIPIMKKY